mgnify:CR=1 FL=1
MNKLIIDNRTDLTDAECLPYVERVINRGRISNNNKQYCYATSFEKDKETILIVITDLNSKSDRFTITEQKKKP